MDKELIFIDRASAIKGFDCLFSDGDKFGEHFLYVDTYGSKSAHNKMERIAKELGFSIVYKEGKARYEYNEEIDDYIGYPDEPRPRERYSSFYYFRLTEGNDSE